jgi:type I restriction enzyme S subunit
MAGEWRSGRIIEIANVTDYVANGSFESLRNNVTYKSQPDYAVLVRLVDHNASWDSDFVYVDRKSYDFLRKSVLEPGDIVIANVGANAGTVFLAPNLGMRMTLGPNAILCKSKDENVLRREFLYYYLISDSGQQSLRSILSGSAQPKFNKTDFRNLSVPIPPLPEQEAIAHILGTLDDKIELNRRINETLEAMARALFKSWFVDFDPVRAKAEGHDPGLPQPIAHLFPDGFENRESGEIPKGWSVGPLQSLAVYISRGIGPSYIETGGICVLNQKCIRNGRIDFSKARRHDPTKKAIEGRKLQSLDILVNSTGVGTLGRVAQVRNLPEEAIVDSHITVVRAAENVDPLFLGINLLERESEIEALGEGSTGQTELSRNQRH